MIKRGLLLAMLAGCSSLPYHPPQFLEPDARFPGLADFAGQRADVLLVHGMCTHDATWAEETVAQLAQALDANVAPAPKPKA